jgi:hypothetical protein
MKKTLLISLFIIAILLGMLYIATKNNSSIPYSQGISSISTNTSSSPIVMVTSSSAVFASTTNTSVSSIPKSTQVFIAFSDAIFSYNSNFSYTKSVMRTTLRSDLGQFAMEQLILGPTPNELANSHVNPIVLTGVSNCGGADFIYISKVNAAAVKFCRNVTINGVGDEARVNAVINNTIKGVTGLQNVQIYDQNGDCLIDPSGNNVC